MPLPDDPDLFEATVRAAVAAVLPSATVERLARTIVAIKLRVDLDRNRFIDVFHNPALSIAGPGQTWLSENLQGAVDAALSAAGHKGLRNLEKP